MKLEERARGDAGEGSEAGGAPGDVEQAGETTAAAAIKGPEDERAIGEGTRVAVEGDPDPLEGASDS